ncbi:DUF6801 domain-containing protein [Amycolatopsis samaneae]|uniref:DUF6801 domain-containing protein n=1 Tax=Amycolatopsis samaneae TaxID=664691 RepID=A0ABW5GB66_9PSEU
MSRIRKLSARAAAAGALVSVAVLCTATAASADATVTYKAGGDPGAGSEIIYLCSFPGISDQPVKVTAHFDGPDSIAHGTTVTPTNVGGTASISGELHSLLTAIGYDGVKGSADVPMNASAGTLSQAAATGLDIPEKIYPADGAPITIVISQVGSSSIPTYTAPASPGSVTFSLGNPLVAHLQFHNAADGSWTPFDMSCAPQQDPPQNVNFSPNGVIS